jgi:hypothetical protein
MIRDYDTFVSDRLGEIRDRIRDAAKRSGRDAEDIEILAVTKFHPIEAAKAAWEAGIRRFGENRVQEAAAKYPAFLAGHQGARLEMLGHLQSNKCGKALDLFSRIASVDSLALLEELFALASTRGTSLGMTEILLELRTAEDSKSGFDSLAALRSACRSLADPGKVHLPFSLRGLMTMAPNVADERAIRESFRRLREAKLSLASEFGFPHFDVLSMGMSGDFEIAVEEGSTLVRIGTALFGERFP